MLPNSQFPPTRWSVISRLRAGLDANAALEELYRAYWFPVYSFIRRRGHTREEAEDLTQRFFHQLLERSTFESADREKGKLRSFLLTILQRMLQTEWAKQRSDRRGGKYAHISIDYSLGEGFYIRELTDQVTPEVLFDRKWAQVILQRALEALRREYAARGMEERFDVLKVAMDWNAREVPGAELAARLGMTENAVNQAVYRLRKDFRRALLEEIRATLVNEDEAAVDEELTLLAQALRP